MSPGNLLEIYLVGFVGTLKSSAPCTRQITISALHLTTQFSTGRVLLNVLNVCLSVSLILLFFVLCLIILHTSFSSSKF